MRKMLKGDNIVEQVVGFKYLGRTISSDGKCEKEIVKIIFQAKVAKFNKILKRNLFTS